MDHEKNVCIKKEDTNEVKMYPSSLKIKEEVLDDTEEVQMCPSSPKIKEELLDDTEEYGEDPLKTEWSGTHVKEEPEEEPDLKFEMDASEHNDEPSADNVDLYNVIAKSEVDDGEENSQPSHTPDSAAVLNAVGHSPNTNSPYHKMNKKIEQSEVKKRQLCVGNMTWWTTDQEVTNTILGIGVADVIEVKFFENRVNGQSKGFCVVTLGSEASVRKCMEKLPKKDLHGQKLIVAHPTKAAINKLETLTKSKVEAQTHSGARKRPQQAHPPRMIGSPLRMRPMMPPPGMPLPHPGQQMPGPPIGYGGPQAHWHPQEPPPGFQHSNWNGPQANGPGGPPSIYGGSPQAPPVPHMNPAFFQQGAGPPHQVPPQQGPPPHHGPPQQGPHFYGPAPAPQPQYGAPQPEHHPGRPLAIDEVEFQEVMRQNKTVSSSAIARAVADAAAGEYASAVETLEKAIYLIKQSKVANDARCKILISSLQDTLNGIEIKSYESARREQARSRDRERSPRSRRERSRSHDRAYRERSRDREREREHDRSYADAYPRERSRSRDREHKRDYRERSHEDRYYDDRYRERELEEDHQATRHEPERERERDRERGRRDERESSHRSTRR